MNGARRTLVFGGVAVLAAAAGVGGAWWRSANGAGTQQAGKAGDTLGDEFWGLRFERPEGGDLRFETLRGRPLLLNFWATWCPPCVEELPLVDRFFRENSASGWQVVGLAIDQPGAVRKFLARQPVSFAIGLAGMSGSELVRGLGNTGGGLPFTLVVNRRGQVAARRMGTLDQAQLDAWRREMASG